MRDDPMTYTITPGAVNDSLVIKLSGPFTISNMFALQAELRTIQPTLAIFDLSESEYMDSAAVGTLINFYVSAEKAGRRMALAGVNERVEALLDLLHVKPLLRVFPDLKAAEAAG
jgi:anti-sigma B factor antagonist